MISGGTEKEQKISLRSKVFFFTIVGAAEVFLSLDTFTTILQLKFMGPKILQKEEMEITECKLSKETILGFPKVKNTK